MSAELIAMQPTKPEARENAQIRIRKQVERIGDLIGENLDFTNGSKSRTLVGNTNYAAFVQSVLEEIRPDAEMRHAIIEASPPPSISLPIDPNVCAASSIPDSNLRLMRCRAAEKSTSVLSATKNEVVTEIEDTGSGIAPEIASSLFEAFATFGKEHGTGLGLSICKKIIEDHGGRIWAEQPGRVPLFASPCPWIRCRKLTSSPQKISRLIMTKIIWISRRGFQNDATHFMSYCRLTVLAGIFSVAGIYFNACQAVAQAQDPVKTFTVTVDKTENGTLSIEPPVPEDGKVPEGTVLTLKASPAPGFALDSHYYRFGRNILPIHGSGV